MTDTNVRVRKRFGEGLTGYHYLVLVVACLGWSFDTMDQWLFVFAKQHAVKALLMQADARQLEATMAPEAAKAEVELRAAEPAYKGRVNYFANICTAALMIGWATGGLFFGMVGDRLGRTRTMALTILIYAGFTGLSGLARTWEEFALFRFMTGLGVGGEFAAGAALVAETFPAHARATALGIVQATSALGNVSAALINLSFASFASPATTWRYLFSVGIIPALLVVVIFMFVREPEAWRQARALAKQAGAKKQIGSILGLFVDPVIRRNTLVGVSLAAVGVIGFWGISVWSPELLRGVLKPSQVQGVDAKLAHHAIPLTPDLVRSAVTEERAKEFGAWLQGQGALTPASVGSFLNPDEMKALEAKVDKQIDQKVEGRISFSGMAQNFGSFFGALGFAWLSQRIGRRYGFVVALLLCVTLIPATFLFTNSFVTALVFFFLMGYALLFLLGGFAVYFPELFPTRLRSTGTGFCYNVARYITAVALFGAGPFVQVYGLVPMVLGVSVVFLLGLLVLPFAPETQGKPLPE